MDIDTLFDNINSAYRGSDDNAPTPGTPDYSLWINTTNRKIFEWARDSKNTWKSLFDIRDVGTVTVGTQSYDLDDVLLVPSDSLIVTTADGQQRPYRLCEPQERYNYRYSAYIHGANPQTVTFNDTITTSSPNVGGAITMPGYYLPDPVSQGSDIVPVDDPYWLVDAVASELAFNDITYASKSADLNARANNLYSIMASNNRRGSYGNPRQLKTMVNVIPDTRTSRIGNQIGNNY